MLRGRGLRNHITRFYNQSARLSTQFIGLLQCQFLTLVSLKLFFDDNIILYAKQDAVRDGKLRLGFYSFALFDQSRAIVQYKQPQGRTIDLSPLVSANALVRRGQMAGSCKQQTLSANRFCLLVLCQSLLLAHYGRPCYCFILTNFSLIQISISKQTTPVYCPIMSLPSRCCTKVSNEQLQQPESQLRFQLSPPSSCVILVFKKHLDIRTAGPQQGVKYNVKYNRI